MALVSLVEILVSGHLLDASMGKMSQGESLTSSSFCTPVLTTYVNTAVQSGQRRLLRVHVSNHF